MKKLISFLITTILTIACGVCLYFCHKSGVLLEDGIESLLYAVGMLAVPFITCSIIGIIYEAEIETEDSYTKLWKVSLGVTVAFLILGIMIVESKRKIFNIDPKLVIDAQIGLPMLINYLMSLWAIFRDKNNPNKVIYHSEDEYIRKKIREQERLGTSHDTSTDTEGAFGFGDGKNPQHLPDNLKGPY